jgi:hypothetical protein
MKPTTRRALSLQRTTLRNLSETELAAADGGIQTLVPPTRTILPPCQTFTVTVLPARCITGPTVCSPTICATGPTGPLP